MRHLKTFFFLACCFAVGMGIMLAVVKLRGHREEAPVARRESGNAPRLRGFSLALEASAGQALERVPALHGSAVALTYPAGRGIAGSDLAAATARAHRLGLKVLLLPPGNFSLRNPYPEPLAAIAAEAQAARVDILCLSWLDGDPDPGYWRDEAASARAVFWGQLVLAATPEILAGLEFSDSADDLGAIGPLAPARRLPHASDDVDLHALRVAWDCVLDSLESLAVKSGKPLLLLNMSITPASRAKLDPPRAPAVTTPDPEFQLLAFQALLLETRGRDAIEGLLLPVPEEAVSAGCLSRLVAALQAQWGASAGEAVTSGSDSAVGVRDSGKMDPG